jgi:serine/threonine protein phosphatase PrpC
VSESFEILASAAATDPGQRSHNEDAYLNDDAIGLYLVADGVGGRDAGEVASRLACETIRARSAQGEDLPAAIAAAHRVIRQAASSSERSRSMAATIVALQLEGNRFKVAWSGDSRAYLWDGRRLLGLTRDHSLVEAMVARREISRAEAASHPRRNVILAALGGESAEPEVGENEGRLAGDVTFLLCSDGLTDVLAPSQLCDALDDDVTLQRRAERLSNEARDAGGRDNITVLLLQVRAAAGEPTAAAFYESYDARSGNHGWPEPERPTSHGPVVRRVKGRSPAPADDTPAPVTPAPSPRQPSAPRQGPGRRVLAAVLLCGLAIAAIIISQLMNTS